MFLYLEPGLPRPHILIGVSSSGGKDKAEGGNGY